MSLTLASHDPGKPPGFVLLVKGTGDSHTSFHVMSPGSFVSCPKPPHSYKLRASPEYWHLKRTACTFSE